jgi:molecular chaperone DnaK
MTKDFAIGIDLGTSTSEISMYRKEQATPITFGTNNIAIMPSLVAIDPNGKILVGELARGVVDKPGWGVREVKRKMGTGEKVIIQGKEYIPEEISAHILQELKENAERALGEKIKDVVISVPASFSDAARVATENAARIAGLQVIKLINEPTAAALAFGVDNIDIEEQLVIFDFGGGTLDITVLEMMAGILDVKSSFGDTGLGGKDFDEKMITLILDKFKSKHPNVLISEKSMEPLKESAEFTKKILSTQISHTLNIRNFAFEGQEGLDLEVEISRKEFEDAIAPLLERTRECVRQALNAKEIKPSTIDRVLLVGGTTYIPAVRKLVAEMFGREPKADINPDLAVGMGASICAALAQNLISEETGIILTDVAPKGLGIEVISEIGGQRMLTYDALILPNTKIPYSVKKLYSLVSASQTEVEIKIYADSKGNARFPNQAEDTGKVCRITDIPAASNGIPYPVEVEFSYNINGVIVLKASIPALGISKEITDEKSDRYDNEIEKAREDFEAAWRQNAKAQGCDAIIDKAERFMLSGVDSQGKTISAQDKAKLSNLVTTVKSLLLSDNKTEIERVTGELSDLIFDLEF